MTDLEAILEPYVNAETMEVAEQELDKLVGQNDVPLGDLYDELAELAAEGDDFVLAARLEEKALDAGCAQPWLVRMMRAWYLLRAGEIDTGEAIFAELEAERPDDVELRLTHGMARADAEMDDAALAAYDDALEVAKRRGFAKQIDRARAERREHREELRLEADVDDTLAPDSPPDDVPLAAAVAWFPPDQREAAVAFDPELKDELAGGREYDLRTEHFLRDYLRELGQQPSVAPVVLDEYLGWAADEGYDPASAGTRRIYAAHLAHDGHAIAWPPGRNDPCWCGSGRKYKKCCGA